MVPDRPARRLTGLTRVFDRPARRGHAVGVTRRPGGLPWPAAALLALVVGGCGPAPSPSGLAIGASPPSGTAAAPSVVPATPVPNPGHELYGFIPYWEMDDTIAADLVHTPLTTVALFSVTSTAKGAIDASKPGTKAIEGAVGAAIIDTAHAAGARVDLVFSSFGAGRNKTFFGHTAVQDATIAALVALVGTLGIDCLDVDVEGLDSQLIPAYGAFVGRLRASLVAAHPAGQVTVATGPGPTGAAMAVAALAAGADRAFLMGYDYRTATSDPGGTSPLARADGGRTLPWSLDAYAAAGVPVTKLLLGLPLYGVRWPVTAPVVGAPRTGNGVVWVIRKHADLLGNSAIVPTVDDLEGVAVYFEGSDGSTGVPSFDPAASLDPSATPSTVTWTAAYVDTPATLARKLGLAESRGLAGAGFWAIGYERGLPAYTDLMRTFTSGSVPPQVLPGG